MSSFRVKQDATFTSVRSIDATVVNLQAENVEVPAVAQSINVEAFNSPVGPIALAASPGPTVTVVPTDLSLNYSLYSRYESNGTTEDSITVTLTDPSLVAGDNVLVFASPAITAPVAPVAVSTDGTVDLTVTFDTVLASGGFFKIDLNVVKA